MVNDMSGKLIAIEGTDGSGKATQTKLLVDRLKQNNVSVTTLAFPQYGKKSAGLVEEYLNGKYGTPENVGPFTTSLFYALDRYDASFAIKQELAKGTIVVLDRYVDSNAGHQGGKIANPTQHSHYLEWLYDLEFGILGIPKPDLVMILHVPVEIGNRLIDQKAKREYIQNEKIRDTHEADLGHLKHAEESYLWLAEHYPENHILIECVEEGKLLSPETIHEEIWNELSSRNIMV